MDKQIKIEIRGGTVSFVTTNFECSYQIIDYDVPEDSISDIYEPDKILLDKDIFEV